MKTLETKVLESLRRAQHEADERARQAIRDASQLIDLANAIDRTARALLPEHSDEQR